MNQNDRYQRHERGQDGRTDGRGQEWTEQRYDQGYSQQQYDQGRPPENPYRQPPYYQGQQTTNGLATASFVLGIISLVFLFVPSVGFIGMITAIVGLILAIVSRKSGPSTLGTAGLVLNIIALVVVTAVFIACTLFVSSVVDIARQLN